MSANASWASSVVSRGSPAHASRSATLALSEPGRGLPFEESISARLRSHQAFAAARLSARVGPVPSSRVLTLYSIPLYIFRQRFSDGTHVMCTGRGTFGTLLLVQFSG